MTRASLTAAAALLFCSPAPQPADQPPSWALQEWPVPWPDTRPRDPYADGRGNVWFVGQRGDYVGKLDPATGAFERFDLDEGTGPHNLIVDQDGVIWYAGNRAAHIGRLDPATGDIRKYPVEPPPGAGTRSDPHTMVFDSQGTIWFTAQGGNFVGHFVPSTGALDVVAVPTPDARPYGIVIDGDDRPWIAEFGTSKLATIDSGMVLREIDLPREDARPRRIEVTSGPTVWYVDYAGGILGRYDSRSGTFKEWPAPAGARSLPYGMALDNDGGIWLAETGPQPNRLVRFDMESERFTDTLEVESGGGTIRHMMTAPDGDIWFGTDANTIGRIHPAP